MTNLTKKKMRLLISGSIVFFALIFITCLLTFIFIAKSPNNATTQSRKIFNSCKKEIDTKKQFCFSKYFQEITEKKDHIFAYETLKQLQKIEPRSTGCHLIAHIISSTETKKDPNNWIIVATSM